MNFSAILHALLRLQPATTWPEWVAALTGLVCVWLTVKNRLSNWPWGILSVLAYSWVFWQAKLYASFGLNLLYFFPCCVYGWWYWAKAGPKRDDDLPVTILPPRMQFAWLGISALVTLAIGLPIAHFTNDPIPYPDALVTGLSIVAQWMQAKKWWDNWPYWILLDIVYVSYIYPTQHLFVSEALYLVYLAIAIFGAFQWWPLIGKLVVRSTTGPPETAPE